MLLAAATTCWTTLINFIIQNYFMDSLATCILWHESFEFQLQPNFGGAYMQFLQIRRKNLRQSFSKDVYNFTQKELEFKKRGVDYHALVEKLTVAIESTHCESFIAFQEDIPAFARAFRNASIFSIWRSQRNKFLFVYRKDLQKQFDYFDDLLFKDQPSILIIEAASADATTLEFKTNKFVGSIDGNPETLYLLDRYSTSTGSFERQAVLYPDKLSDLQGRELVVGVFDYRPFVALDFQKQPQVRDRAPDNPQGRVYFDGTEVRLLMAFCERHNCTLEADTSEKSDWGFVYPNNSGFGVLGKIAAHQTQMGLMGMYSWDNIYALLDLSAFIGRSGITCLVPAPTRITAWDLPLQPFQSTLWLSICACLLVEMLSLFVTSQLESSVDGTAVTRWSRNLQFSFNTVLKLFISQYSKERTSSSAVRVVLFACYVTDIIVTSVYGGGLATVLTLPTLSKAADTLERLYQYQLLWSGSSQVWILSLLDVKDNPIIEGITANFRQHSIDEMRELAKTENMGFIIERMTYGHFADLDFLTPTALERLKPMIDNFYIQFTVVFVPRLWPMLARFNDIAHSWHDCGLDKYWEWKATADFLNIQQQQHLTASMTNEWHAGAVKLDLKNFAGLMLVWLLGMTASVIAFALELLWHKRQQMKRQQLSRVIWKAE